MTKLSAVLLIFTIIGMVSARWENHEYSSEVSGQIANAIKQKLYIYFNLD